MAEPTLRLVKQLYSEADARAEIDGLLKESGLSLAQQERKDKLAVMEAIAMLVKARRKEQG